MTKPTPISGGAPYAHVVNGVVTGPIYTLPDGWTLQMAFTADIAAQYVAVPNGVAVAEFWTYANGVFAAPV
jgi:hypothetical protein